MKPGSRFSSSFVAGLLLCSGLVAAPDSAEAPVRDEAAATASPLKPLDRSTPRAALTTFLETADSLAAYLESEYLDSPSRTGFQEAMSRGNVIIGGLDLSEIPLATRKRVGQSAAIALYETLNRIPLPEWEAIPEIAELGEDAQGTVRWVIPDTEIILERTTGSGGKAAFLFSSETVVRAFEFREKVQNLPYQRVVPLEDLGQILRSGGGWMIPYSWVRGLPFWLQKPVAEQALWKWLGLILILGVGGILIRLVYRFSRWHDSRNPFLQALAQFSLPACVLVLTPVVVYLARIQLKLVGDVAVVSEIIGTALIFVTGAWLVWRAAPVVAEAVITSPRIASESIDAHLIRIFTRLIGLVLAVILLTWGASMLGIHLYGIIAGLGVGGLAIALAAQPTVENLIGGLSLFADRPVRVGDFCKYGDELGTIEDIGIRSTRIRGLDRTLTTIPNGVLSKMAIVNLTQRDRMLLTLVIGLRYETTPDQLRHVLAKLRELLSAHSKVAEAPRRVRLTGFGNSSLDVEVFGYIETSDWNEFLSIREDIYLRMIDVIAASGTSFAFPSQTLYLGRDEGLNPNASTAKPKTTDVPS